MSDVSFNEEFDIVVDEIAALYVAGQFEAAEKEQVERYFLRAPERQHKVKFVSEFLHQVALPPGELAADNPADSVAENAPQVVLDDKPGLWHRFQAFWNLQPPALRTATMLATIVIVVGVLFAIRSINSPVNYATIELTMTSADRSTGSETQKISLSSGTDELRLKLKLPTPTPTAKSYRATVRGERLSQRPLNITEQNSDSLTAVISANELTPGTYIVDLFAINEGAEQQLRGAYVFRVE